ncbi:Peroxisomal nicotinamide adenine dinucleotide carrier [Forsythia ovata]|uniref:Peroxisomal nicotinamide adenine dinucleotide carrier n=1 Tax=Forsythia ovata TaxID=205694 RepID=A0ABD1RIF8_9LAMI
MSNAVVNGMAGAGGGIVAQIITYPLQTELYAQFQVNTRQQTERVAKKDSTLPPATSPARGTLVQIFQVIKSEGLGGLYSGLKPSLLGTAASQAFKNKAEAIAAANRKKGRGDGSPGMLSWLLVAALAGSVNVLLTNPIWVLVTRMQTHTQAERKIVEAKREALLKEASENVLTRSSLQDQLAALDSVKPRPYGTLQAACEVFNESGITGFWKGIIPTLIMSRLQAKQEIGGNISLRYSGTLDAIVKMIRYEGLSCFYKGMSTKIVQSVFAASVLFMIKEELVKAYALVTNKSQKILSNVAK